MALLRALLSNTASSTDLNWELLTLGVTNKLARLLLNVACGTGGLIHSPALLRSLSIAHLFKRLVALFHILFNSLLLEGNLTSLFKVFLTDLLLSRLKLCDIGVMALFHILVGTFKDGILLQGGDALLLFNATESGLGVCLTAGEVDAALNGNTVSSSKLAAKPDLVS
jgi:hypothetical protein